MTNYLFCYGTLKRGACNHYLLNGCKFIGHGKAYGCVLLEIGAIPGLIPGRVAGEQHDHDAVGEVYEIPNERLPYLLNRLDSLENNGKLYIRAVVTVDMLSYKGCSAAGPNRRILDCIVYFYMLNLNLDAIVKDGNWGAAKCQAVHGLGE